MNSFFFQVDNACSKTEQKLIPASLDQFLTEEIRQARIESQVAISTVVEQYKVRK